MSEEASTKLSQQRGAGEGGGAPGASRAGEGTLRTFAELEQHFERIKKLHAQTAEREAELDRIAAQVEARTKEIETRTAELDARVRAIDEDRATLDAEREKAEAVRRELKGAHQQLVEQRKALEGERKTATETAATLEALRAELEEREGRVSALDASLKEKEGALALEEKKLAGASQSLAADRAALEKQLSETGARDESLRTREQALEERARALSEAQERLVAEQKELAQARAKVEQQLAELARDRQKLDAEQKEAAATQQRLAAMMKAVQARASELEEREKALAAREKGHQKGAAAAAAAERAADEQVRTLEASLAERAALLAARDAEIAKLKGETEKLTAAVEQARAAAAKAGEAAAKTPDTKAPSPAAAAELEKSRRAIELLAEKLRGSQRETEQLRRRLEEASARGVAPKVAAAAARGDGRVVLDAHNALRRRRLQKYKALLQTQARKIMSAQAALTKRQAEAEQILAHRSKLAAAAEHIREREKKIMSQRAKSAGAAIAFSFAGTAAAMAGLAWMVATKAAPATYVASATLGADARGRQESIADLEGWQAYQNELVSDPQFIAQTAERVGRRGIAELGTPAAFQSYLRTNLIVDSPKDGEFVLRLKGTSAQRTASLLDTLVTAAAATANLTRAQRPDGLVTEITVPVETPTEPVVHKRLEYAGAIFGGGMLLSLSLAGMGWRRVSRSRQRALADEAVEGFLDEKHWPAMQQG